MLFGRRGSGGQVERDCCVWFFILASWWVGGVCFDGNYDYRIILCFRLALQYRSCVLSGFVVCQSHSCISYSTFHQQQELE